MGKKKENKISSLIGNSGNSDVDLIVNLTVNTKAIAYGIICSLYAKGEISEKELDKAIEKLDSLIETEHDQREPIINYPNAFEHRKRNWIKVS